MCKFLEAEKKGRNLFIKTFGKYLQAYKENTEKYAGFDMFITGITKRAGIVEIKTTYKFVSIEDRSGCTFIKYYKIKEIKKELEKNPNLKAYYVIFLSDGILLYDLTDRIKNNELKVTEFPLGLNTVEDDNQTIVNTQVCWLSSDKKYGDKIYTYTATAGKIKNILK